MNHQHYNGNRDSRNSPNWGKGNQQKPKFDFEHTVESTTGIKLKIDIAFFSFRDMEQFNKELKIIGVDELSVSKKFQNEVAWISLPDTSKVSRIQEIYHGIAVGTAMGENIKIGQGVTTMPSNISGNILSKTLSKVAEGKTLVHCGAIGLSDVSFDFYAAGKFNASIPLQDGFFHFYEGSYITKDEYIQHDLAVEYPGEQFIKRGNRAAITTEPLNKPKHEFNLRPNRKAVIFTYKFLDVIEKYEGEFLPIYEITPYFFNQTIGGSAQMSFGRPVKRVDSLVSIAKDYQRQGYGYVTRAAIDDLKLISEHDINAVLKERGIDTKFIIDLRLVYDVEAERSLPPQRFQDTRRPKQNNVETSTKETKKPVPGKKTKLEKLLESGTSKFEAKESDMTASVESVIGPEVKEESVSESIEPQHEIREVVEPTESDK